MQQVSVIGSRNQRDQPPPHRLDATPWEMALCLKKEGQGSRGSFNSHTITVTSPRRLFSCSAFFPIASSSPSTHSALSFLKSVRPRVFPLVLLTVRWLFGTQPAQLFHLFAPVLQLGRRVGIFLREVLKSASIMVHSSLCHRCWSFSHLFSRVLSRDSLPPSWGLSLSARFPYFCTQMSHLFSLTAEVSIIRTVVASTHPFRLIKITNLPTVQI